jgi:short-subunit dehydrogenase
VAQIYASRGARLHLVGRNADKLQALVTALPARQVTAERADLDDTAAADALVCRVWDRLEGIDVAVIAHGLLGDQLATEQSYVEAEAVVRTNFLSPVALLIPLANRMEAAAHGHLAVMSSVAGERGRPRNYTYGAAKGALTTYLEGLRTRLWSKRIGVSIFKIGPTDTPMTATHRKNALFARPEHIARGLVRAVDRGPVRGGGAVYLPWYWAPIMAGVRVTPEGVFQRLGFLSGR